MGTDRIQVTVTAATGIQHGLTAYERAFAAALDQARTCLNRAQAEFQMAVVKSQQQLREAERVVEMARATLGRCTENCQPLVEALRRCQAAEVMAKMRLESNRAARAQYERAASDLSGSLRTIEASTKANLSAARQNLLAYAEDLSRYLRTPTGGDH